MAKYFRARSAIAIFCLLLLCSVLTACSGGQGASTTATPTSMPTHAPMPTPMLTPTPTSPATFTQLPGYGYTIGSPANWIINRDTTTVPGVSVLRLTDLTDYIGSTAMTIAADARGLDTRSPLDRAQNFLDLAGQGAKNFQKKSVPSMVTINGVQWAQVAATMKDSTTGVEYTMYVLAALFPSDATKLLIIAYTAPTSDFNQINTADFQPMLLSFQFM